MSHLLPVYPRLPITLIGAHGVHLRTDDGREILDLYGAHAVCPLGHAHPELTDALTRAHRTLDFYSNSLHLPVQERAASAVLGTSEHLQYVHFVNSGTEANEAALHTARKLTGRSTIVTLTESFHGRTLASLSVTGLEGYRRKVPLDVPADWLRTMDLGADDLSVIDEGVAAVMIESVPSLGGIQMPPDGWLARVAERAREVGAFFILDEVQGGVGRLGRWFGHEALGVQPDMVTLAKSLGNGFPVAAMVTTQDIGDRLAFGDLGTTFGGGPMACTMVEKVAEIIRRDGLMGRVLELETIVREGLEGLAGVEVRGRGALLGIQTPRPAGEVRDELLARGILVGTSTQPHTLRLLMPYVVSDAHVQRFTTALAEVLDV